MGLHKYTIASSADAVHDAIGEGLILTAATKIFSTNASSAPEIEPITIKTLCQQEDQRARAAILVGSLPCGQFGVAISITISN